MNHPIDVHVGAQLRRRRLELGMNLRTLGDKVGIAYQQIQRYEKGANRIACPALWSIAKALETNVQYFFKGYKEPKEEINKNEMKLVVPDLSKISLEESQKVIVEVNKILMNSIKKSEDFKRFDNQI